MLNSLDKIMKNFVISTRVILFLSFLVSVSKCEDSNSVEFQEKWFEQYLNNFDLWDNRTFDARYFENGEFFRPNGPLLLQIGAEETINADALKEGPSYALAKRTKGMIVLLEHRYYGKSFPFEDAEFSGQ